MGDLNELVERVRREGDALAAVYQKRDFEQAEFTCDAELVSNAICRIDQAAAALTSVIAERDGLRERVNALQHAEADRRIWRQFYGALLAVPPDDAIPLEVRVHRQAQIITSMQYRLRNLRREIRRHIGRDPLEPLHGYHVGRHVNKLYSLWRGSEAQLKAAREHIEQLAELLKIIKEAWVDYDHVYSISVHEADEFLAARTALSLDTNKGDGV